MSKTAAAGASCLLGVSVALTISGVALQFEGVFGQGAAARGAVVAGALLALGLGVRVPQRFALWLCAVAWRRFVRRGQVSDISAVALGPENVDRPLYWVVLSVIAVSSGILATILPYHVRLAREMHLWLGDRFVWSDAPLVLVQFVLAFGAALLPLAVLGSGVACCHHLCCRFSSWEGRATAWLVLGAAGGAAIAASLDGHASAGGLMLLASALPALLVALIAVVISSVGSDDGTSGDDVRDVSLPVCSDEQPALVRTAVIGLGVTVVCLTMLWMSLYADQVPGSGSGAVGMLLAVGCGALAAHQSGGTVIQSVGGLGILCGAAGIALAGSAIMVAHRWLQWPSGMGAVACVTLVLVAFATACGIDMLLHRVARRSSVGASILGRTLLGGAIGGSILVPALAAWASAETLLVGFSLLLMGFSGLLVWREPGYSARKRRLGIGAAFGSMLILLGTG